MRCALGVEGRDEGEQSWEIIHKIYVLRSSHADRSVKELAPLPVFR